jgi:hypothetical protein
MSFVNEVGFRELLNELTIDEKLVVEGDATVEKKLTVKDLEITGTLTGVQLDPTFTVGDETDVSLVDKIGGMDTSISDLATAVSANQGAIATKASKTLVDTKAPLANPNFTGDISIEGETLTSKLSAFETASSVDARFVKPTFAVDDIQILGTTKHPLEDIKLDVSVTRAVNGQEITIPATTNLKTVLDSRYATSDGVASDISSATQQKVDKTNAEMIGTTLEDVVRLILIPDPLQPAARTETNLQTLLDAKPEIDTVYSKDEVDALVNAKADAPAGDTYATTSALNLGLNLKQDAPTSGAFVLNTELAAQLIGKQDVPQSGTSFVLNTDLTTGLNTKQDKPAVGTSFVLDTDLATALNAKQDAPTDGTTFATTADLSDYATTQSVNAINQTIQGLATTTYVNNQFAVKTDPSFNITGFGTGKTLSQVINHFAPSTDISGKLDRPADFGTGTLADYIATKAPTTDISGKLDTPSDFGTGTLADYISLKAPAVSGKLDTPADFGDGTLADYIATNAPTTDISGKLDRPADFGSGTLADYISLKAPAVSGKLDTPADFGDGTLTDYIQQVIANDLPRKTFNFTFSSVLTLQDPNNDILQGIVNPQLTFTKQHTISGTYSLEQLISELSSKIYDAFDLSQHGRNGSITYNDIYHGYSYRRIYGNYKYAYGAGENYRVTNISFDFYSPFNNSENQTYITNLFGGQTTHSFNPLNVPGIYDDVFSLYFGLSSQLESIEDKVYKQASEVNDSIKSYFVMKPTDYGPFENLDDYISRKSVSQPRIYPPTPFPYDYIANETFGSYTISGQPYGNGTYTLRLSGVLNWGYPDHDVDTVMNEGNMPIQPSGSISALHIPSGTQTWVEFKLPYAITLKMYKITTRDYDDTPTDGYVGAAPRDFDVEGRNSSSASWTKIDIRRDVKFYRNETQTFYINDNAYQGMTTTAFNEFRLFIHRNQNTNAWLIIRELSYWGTE